MTVKSYQYTFGAGDSKQYRGGGFFTIEQLTDEVDVELFTPRGTSLGLMENIGAGFWIRIPEENGIFGYAEVTSATAQTINVIAGDGEFGVNKTSTSITGGTLDPHTPDSSYYDSTNTATLQTIVTPAANVSGVIIHHAHINYSSSVSGVSRLMYKSSAPTGFDDATAATIAISNLNTTTAQVEQSERDTPIIVPAGNGIYHQNSTTLAVRTSVLYTVL